MNQLKRIFQRVLTVVGEAFHQRPIRCLAVLLVSCAGLAYALAPTKDAATQSPNNLPVKESKTQGVTANTEAIAALEKELSERMNKLEERERQLYSQSLEASRKSMDWWFSFLAVLTALVGVTGALIPYFMGKRDSEARSKEYELKKAELEELTLQAQQAVQSEIAKAKQLVKSIEGEHQKAKAIGEELSRFVSGQMQTPEQKQQTTQEAQAVAQDPTASKLDKLYARAVLASQVEAPTLAQGPLRPASFGKH